MGYKIRIKSFASFDDSDVFEISEGLNVLGGINNAGKTALLWALAMLGMPADSQRRWYQILYNRLGGYLRPGISPTVLAEFALPRGQRDSIVGRICGLGGNPQFPPYEESKETFQFSWTADANRNIGFRGEVIVRSGNGRQRAERNVFQFLHAQNSYSVIHPFGGSPPNTWQPANFTIKTIGSDSSGERIFRFAEGDTGLAPCWPQILSNSILLEAQRKVDPGRASMRTVELEPDAANLAQVLETAQLTTVELRDGQERFRRIVEEMRAIFPEVLRIRTQVPPQAPGQQPPVEILLDLAHQRTVPLTHSGTGVQQILALLTGAILQPRPTLFLIDEPHSNLHPAAERSLMRVLEAFARESDHIFCVTTQSTIMASHARRRFRAVAFHDADGSKVRPLSGVAEICGLLGIENMDLFTYDRILFVEGPSDVPVLQRVFQFFDKSGTFDRTKIVELFGDGRLKSPKMALDLVRLIVNAATSQMHVPVGLLLDSNDWSKDERLEIEKALNVLEKSSVAFLESPELEDYLIHEGAVARLLAEDASALNIKSDEGVSKSVASALAESKGMVKGSDRLNHCFSSHIVGHEFRKKRDCARLADAILALEPDFLLPLYEEATRFIQSIGSRSGAQR